MAKRQSLRDLQERLAKRLTAARSEVATASWLAVEAGGQRYLLPLVQSGEIFPWAAIQLVPYTKPWFVGVANLRGGLNGVVDLARLVGHNEESLSKVAVEDRVTSDARLISLHAALGINAVLWIDRLQGLRNPAAFASLGDKPDGAPSYFARSLVDHQGQAWQELDLMGLTAEPEFMAIAA
jgi:twitching motility protein PilI